MSSNTATDEFPLADVSTFVHDSLVPISYPPDSVIFEEGESSDNAYIIDQGNVQISVNDNGAERVVATLGPGELLGEMATLDTNNRSPRPQLFPEPARHPPLRSDAFGTSG